MCTNGVNTAQLSATIAQIDEAADLLEKDDAAQAAVEAKLV